MDKPTTNEMRSGTETLLEYDEGGRKKLILVVADRLPILVRFDQEHQQLLLLCVAMSH